MKPIFTNKRKWVQFNYENTLALYNVAYEEKILNVHLKKECFNNDYVNKFLKEVKEQKSITW